MAALIGGAVMLWVTTRPADVPDYIAPVEETPEFERTVIGSSVEGRAIEAYTLGDGDTHLVFVGGIHGGYEWNSVLLAYTAIDHITENTEMIPKDMTVTIIPVANPDGLYTVTGMEGRFTRADVNDPGDGTGRFNANDVDLNRNFDCKWAPESTWRSQPVSAGTAAFSEPEAAALRDFVYQHEPDAVVFWHSQSNAVYASECHEGVLPQTRAVMNAYATAAGYPAIESFDAYPITGDAEGWLATLGIPAITVELSTHETIEWEQNWAGVEALFEYYNN
ncbi:MAG: M14 family metallopeptidase [Candidatus Paceibacterota bacterium]